MSETILEVKNLKKYYSYKSGLFKKREIKKAVDDISFELHRGETLALVGESGCGKTTAMKSLLRIIEPTSGEILLNGKNFTNLNKRDLKKERRNIKIIFQDPYSSLNPRMTVEEIIAEPLDISKSYKNKKERNKIVKEVMELVNLDLSFASRYPHEFSGGQRQRIGIARAVVLRPEIIICDEPVSALDVSVQAKIINLLKDLQKKLNISYIFISHDLGVVKYMADRILVMKNGKIIEQGNSDEVFNNPKEEYTRMLLNSIPKIKID
jgi:peptide/nickel transport system ATP-binding protein/oligopeptide transport system ATP-binding protein